MAAAASRKPNIGGCSAIRVLACLKNVSFVQKFFSTPKTAVF
jgi:hypothetical protein